MGLSSCIVVVLVVSVYCYISQIVVLSRSIFMAATAVYGPLGILHKCQSSKCEKKKCTCAFLSLIGSFVDVKTRLLNV